MDEIQVLKVEEKYTLVGKNPSSGDPLEISLTVHLDNEKRTMSITGKNNMFEFKKSDPYLIEGMIQLFDRAIEVGNAAKRLKLPEAKKS